MGCKACAAAGTPFWGRVDPGCSLLAWLPAGAQGGLWSPFPLIKEAVLAACFAVRAEAAERPDGRLPCWVERRVRPRAVLRDLRRRGIGCCRGAAASAAAETPHRELPVGSPRCGSERLLHRLVPATGGANSGVGGNRSRCPDGDRVSVFPSWSTIARLAYSPAAEEFEFDVQSPRG